MRGISSGLCLGLVILILSFSKGGIAQGRHSESELHLALRLIGHEVLLASGDSTSRVLPIESFDSTYRIRFESDFAFFPDTLISTVARYATKTDLADGFIVEVEECLSGKVVYAFEMSLEDSTSLLPCLGRFQPKGCYTLLFTLTHEFGHEMHLGHEDLDKATFPWMWISGGGFILLLGIFAFRRKRNQSSDQTIQLGEFKFNPRSHILIRGKEKVELTGKESQLLNLLLEEANQTVDREIILNRVWGDEGDYIGRTLDVFISKLRKKLQPDPNLKITNIRGVGYKLIVGP